MVKKLFLVLIVVLGLYLLREGYFFWQMREFLPAGTTIGTINVSELTLQNALVKVIETYSEPVLVYLDGESAIIEPQTVGFVLDIDGIRSAIETKLNENEWWLDYAGFVLKRPLEPVGVPLLATHDPTALVNMVSMVGDLLDNPAKPPRVEPETLRFLPGEAGFVADIATTTAAVETALYSATDRTVPLATLDESAPALDLQMLGQVLEEQLSTFSGVGSIFIMDLTTGEEYSYNADVAVSGVSTMKVAILLEVYRRIDNVPDFDQQKLINETAIYSGNYSANLLLDVIAGQDNAYLGSDILTDSMQDLGLVNTFIVTPYEEPARPDKPTLITPANSRTDINLDPDPAMQTTAEDAGTLLAMIYDCSKGGGALLAFYADELTPNECQSILDVLALNVEGNLIRFGVPHGVPVSHKHGWDYNTHGDAGIVFSPAGDYVIVTYLADPAVDWLVADYSFPILREMSRITYNYFNQDAPYVGNPLEEEKRFESADSTPIEIPPLNATPSITTTEIITP
jgi:beta-lactamase class A